MHVEDALGVLKQANRLKARMPLCTSLASPADSSAHPSKPSSRRGVGARISKSIEGACLICLEHRLHLSSDFLNFSRLLMEHYP